MKLDIALAARRQLRSQGKDEFVVGDMQVIGEHKELTVDVFQALHGTRHGFGDRPQGHSKYSRNFTIAEAFGTKRQTHAILRHQSAKDRK